MIRWCGVLKPRGSFVRGDVFEIYAVALTEGEAREAIAQFCERTHVRDEIVDAWLDPLQSIVAAVAEIPEPPFTQGFRAHCVADPGPIVAPHG